MRIAIYGTMLSFNLNTENFMTVSLEGCRNYTRTDVKETLKAYNFKYNNEFISRVNEICLSMGCFCKDNKPKFETLKQELTKEIDCITTDELEKDELWDYAWRIVSIGQNYLILNQRRRY